MLAYQSILAQNVRLLYNCHSWTQQYYINATVNKHVDYTMLIHNSLQKSKLLPMFTMNQFYHSANKCRIRCVCLINVQLVMDKSMLKTKVERIVKRKIEQIIITIDSNMLQFLF